MDYLLKKQLTNDICPNKMKGYETQSLLIIIKFVLVFIKTKKIVISDIELHDMYKTIQK